MSQDKFLDSKLENVRKEMDQAINHLSKELLKVRAGKASPQLLNGVMVEYYGNPTPINQVANISVTDPKTLQIQPWDKSVISSIEQAIFAANLGLTPQNDGDVIRIIIPPLTEERRKQLVKQAKSLTEEAKVSIRSSRQKAMNYIKEEVKEGYPEDAGKRMEEKVQDWTNSYTKKAEEIHKAKEKDIMTI